AMKPKPLRIPLLLAASLVAILVGGGWKMLSDSNEFGSPSGLGIGGPEMGAPEMGATTLNAYSVHSPSEAPKAGIPAYSVKSYLVSKHPAAAEEQSPLLLDTFDAAPKPEHSDHRQSIVTVAKDNGTPFSPYLLSTGGNLPPVLGGFDRPPHSGVGSGNTGGSSVPPHNSNSTPPGNGDGASDGNNGTPNSTPPPDNQEANSNVPPSGIVPPGPSDSYTKTELPPIGLPVDQGKLNGTPPLVPTQGSADTDSPNPSTPSPVPDNGLTLILLGISFIGLLGLKRRMGCPSS
ncbi:MAG: VPDSG-CTERM sorting domain-containing protein, partial [Lacunisphaera sp.]